MVGAVGQLPQLATAEEWGKWISTIPVQSFEYKKGKVPSEFLAPSRSPASPSSRLELRGRLTAAGSSLTGTSVSPRSSNRPNLTRGTSFGSDSGSGWEGPVYSYARVES
uniref:Uncharacterized protein n=1 Tax=Hemiselmis andersenii TaxID=464988 RepID=A0A7S1GYI1_HEMAN